jgi:aryl-alcohol dehydrogenase-like predicted oxidoreductase
MNNEISRAAFLRLMAGVGAAALVGQPGVLLAGQPAAAAAPMARRSVPKTGVLVPVVGVGTARAWNVGTRPSDRAAHGEILRLLFEAGGSVVDTSPMYGNAETVAGDLLRDLGLGKRAFIATKVWTSGRQSGIDQMEASMRLLHRGHIDLMQVHNLVDTETHLATLRGWKEKGIVRHIGITHWTRNSVDTLAEIVAREKLDFVQLPYSLGMRAAESRLLPLCADKGVAVIVNRPFVRGSMFREARGRSIPPWAKGELGISSWAQYFLKYLLGHPAVTCVIPGTGKPRHMADNIQAGMGRLPTARQHKKMLVDWQRI